MQLPEIRRDDYAGVRAVIAAGLLACSPPRGGEIRPESGLVGAAGTADTALGALAGGGQSGSASEPSVPPGEPNEADSSEPDRNEGGAVGDASPSWQDAGAPSVPPLVLDAGPYPGAGVADSGSTGAALDPALAQRYAELSARLSRLAARTVSFWLQHGPDAELGGFHATLDRQGNPVAPEDKGVIQQARQLWMLSLWYQRRESTPAVRASAEQVYGFFRRSFLDPADGGFVYKVSRDGSRVLDAKKQLFAESYAIYALSSYGRVFGDAEATALALSRFLSIDAGRHDAVNGGYDQRTDPGTLTPGAEKDTNTHLHLMEAFSALYEATEDARVAARLSELVDLFATRLRQPSGYVHAEFTRSWAPFGAARVSYGHDLETSWLLLDAARVLGRSDDTSLRAAALAIAAHSAGPGFDTRSGGFFESGPNGGAADDLDKVWWVQFEATEGLWWAHELDPQALYLDRLGRTLDWIELAEDLPVGEWFATTNADGSAAGADYKSDEWKDSYHPVRALVFLQDWIDARLAGRALP
ncbi:MAG: AGE family epimerase/isomerase [Deltaproteobacteria bacterium]